MIIINKSIKYKEVDLYGRGVVSRSLITQVHVFSFLFSDSSHASSVFSFVHQVTRVVDVPRDTWSESLLNYIRDLSSVVVIRWLMVDGIIWA